MHAARRSAASAWLALLARRWHEPGPPPLSARHSRELATAELQRRPLMTIVAGLDVHRAQITFDALDRETGEVKRGRVRATPEAVREWAEAFAGAEVHVAVEAGTGWVCVWGGARGGGGLPPLPPPPPARAPRGPQ